MHGRNRGPAATTQSDENKFDDLLKRAEQLKQMADLAAERQDAPTAPEPQAAVPEEAQAGSNFPPLSGLPSGMGMWEHPSQEQEKQEKREPEEEIRDLQQQYLIAHPEAELPRP